jgi:hypothetical protein
MIQKRMMLEREVITNRIERSIESLNIKRNATAADYQLQMD